jgi:hypothetical protein
MSSCTFIFRRFLMCSTIAKFMPTVLLCFAYDSTSMRAGEASPPAHAAANFANYSRTSACSDGDGLIPPPVTANTSCSVDADMVNATRLDATRLAPQQLHNVMILLMVTIMAMIGLLHMMLTFLVLVIRKVMG